MSRSAFRNRFRPRNPRNPRKDFRGFTLIELLVVISIIALMISILLPSLAKAKGVAQQVKCGSNLHQIYLGIAGYNYDNRKPLMMWFGPAVHDMHLEWVRNILPYVNDTPHRYNCWNQGSINTWCGTDEASQARTAWRANKLFVCPANDRTHPGVPWGAWNDTYWVSYATPAIIFSWGDTTQPGKAVWPMRRAHYPIDGSPGYADEWVAAKPFGTTSYAIIGEAPTAAVEWYELYPSNAPGPLYHEMHNQKNNFLLDGGAVTSRHLPYHPDFWTRYWSWEPVVPKPFF